MANKVMQNAEKMKARHERKNIWQKIVIFLCCVVVFCTTYALILPAITMENNPVCGFVEHQHDESCFTQPEEIKQLICTDESDHVHDESCYHDVDVLTDLLVCEDESHEHDETCYTKVVKQELDCKHEHSEECKETIEHKELSCETEHEHTDECYQITIEEIDDCKHEHSEECYKNVKEKQLNCEIHAHDDSCYEIIIPEKELSCDIPVHTHNESCYEAIDLLVQGVIEKINVMPSADEIDAELLKYEENEDYEGYEAYYTEVVEQVVSTYHAYSKLTDEQKVKVTNADKLLELEYIWSMHVLAEPIDLTPYITTVIVQHRENEFQEWQDLTSENNKVNAGDELRFTIKYRIDGNKLSTTNNTVIYEIPNQIKLVEEDSGVVTKDGVRAGTYDITEDGTILITFDDDYCIMNANGSPLDGDIAFESSVDSLESDTTGNAEIPIGDVIQIQIIGKENNTNDLQVNKTSSINAENGTIEYVIEVSSANGTGSTVILTDVMQNAQLKDINSIEVKDENKDTVKIINSQSTSDGFVLELPQMDANSKYYITYTAYVPNIENLNGEKVINNEVDVESIDNVGGKLVDNDTTNDTLIRNVLSKSGVKDGNNIKWTIIINESKLDIGKWTLSDQLRESKFEGYVTISPNPESKYGNGSLEVKLPYTFPENSKDTYTVTYSTPIDSSDGSEISNMAILTAPDGSKIESSTGVSIRDNENGIDKRPAGIDLNGETEDGNSLGTYKWKVRFNATKQPLEPYVQTVDNVNRKVWVYSDELENADIHWITGAQLKELKTNLQTALSGIYNSTFEIYAYRWDGQGWFKYRDPVLVDNNLADTNKYSQFRILFYGAIEKGNKVEVGYSTTVNLKDGKSAVSASNLAILNEHESESRTNQYYSPLIYKEDRLDPNGGSITYHSTEEIYRDWVLNNENKPGGVPRILSWNVYVTVPKPNNEDGKYSDDDELVIIEKLPEGVNLYENYGVDTGYHAVSFQVGEESETVSGNGHFIFKEGSNITGFFYCIYTKGKSNQDEPDDYVPIMLERNNNELKFIIPPIIANGLIGVTNKITIMVQIDEDYDWKAISEEFKNTAIISHNGVELGQASQTQVVRNPVIHKEIKAIDGNIIPYVLTINKNGIDLIPDKDTLTLIDELEFNKPSSGNVNANLMLDTVKVYKFDSDGNKIDITKQCPLTTTETDTGSKIIKKFVMNVPDSTKVIVEYSYMISGKTGTQINILNNASIEGYSTTVDEDDYQYNLNIQQSNATVSVDGINIVKVDAENNLLKLEAAVFKLEKKVNGKFIEIYNNLKTGNKGTITLENLDENTIYRITEIEAPYGYELGNTEYEFIISQNRPNGFNGFVLNKGDSIIIENKKAPYELPETGGIGTHIFYIGGIALMLIAFIAYHILQRKERCNE